MKTAEELKESQRSALTASASGIEDSPLRALAEEIMLDMPGLSDVECRKALQRVAREFCERTNCWTIDAEFGPCAPFGGYPVVNIPAGAVAIRAREKSGGWFSWGCGWGSFPGPHPFFFPTRLVPYAPPPARGEYIVALAPDVGSEELDPKVLQKWGAAFANGAKAHLMAMSNRSWSDPQSAAVYGQKYNAALNEARGAFELGGVPSHMQTRSKVPFVI